MRKPNSIIINEVKLIETQLTKFAFQSIPFIIISVTKFYKDGLMVPVPCRGGWDILSAWHTCLYQASILDLVTEEDWDKEKFATRVGVKQV